MDPRPPGVCPFLNKPCLRDKCELWSGLDTAQPTGLAGIARQNQVEGCVFQLQLFAATISRSGPPAPARPAGPSRS
jgi:hypothetical protein